ncbi:class I adenylate-forming enzyme family protein [Nocardia wallacei]|uniref:2,3-dihydroxybenzoate-AMP ligase n=1 Tax=Nocardia wallacei TaxID=480035 RepID=A0A7G1KME0_9NOCA|nr:class I adenylate-forming enzyme family protein [Nocardia wallacei]BCK56001.1 2,3-dihydroxybenzoate-AMP ligase [Nocardia wallacei]
MTLVENTSRYTDLVPAELRGAWSAAGHYPGSDIYTLFARHVARHPDKPAVVDADGTVTYAELDDLTVRLAAGLSRLGIGAEDVVAVQLPNSRLACAADLAVAALGAIVLPFPVGRGTREAATLLRRSEAVAVIALAEHNGQHSARLIREMAADLPALRAVIGVGRHSCRGCVPIHALLAPDAGDFRPHRPDADGPARILVTSGSEAEPKMVLYSHNALTGGRGAMLAALHDDDPATMRNLFLVPLASAFGSSGTAVTLAAFGATLVLQPRFDPTATLAMVEKTRPTHLLGVPTMLRLLLDHPAAAATDPSGLRAIVLGGSPLDSETARRGRDLFRCPVINLYGSADGVSSHPALDDPADRATTAGRPDPAVAEIRVVDSEFRALPPGQVGEIIARGPMSPMCYVGAAELDTALRTPGGWTRTGDLGRFDTDGYLTVVGRSKDVIIRGGLNISPAEVEAVLLAHPAVTDVACVPIPDPLYGERLCACLVATEPLTLHQLTEHLVGQGLEPRKFPERLLQLPSLPLGPAGKVDRRALQAQARQRSRER